MSAASAVAGATTMVAMVRTAPRNGLVAEYLFGGGPDDTSGNGHDGTVDGAVLVQDRFGNAGQAYFFDNGGSIDFSGTGDLTPTQSAFSLSFWIDAATQPMTSAPIAGKHIHGYLNGYSFGIVDSRLEFYVSGVYITSEVVSLSGWNMVSIVWSPADGLGLIYLNGSLLVSGTASYRSATTRRSSWRTTTPRAMAPTGTRAASTMSGSMIACSPRPISMCSLPKAAGIGKGLR